MNKGAKTKGGVKGGNEQYIQVSVSLKVMGDKRSTHHNMPFGPFGYLWVISLLFLSLPANR